MADASEGSSLPPDADGHTAIYDIVAQRVYLPNGQRLEAHSGFGSYLDDPHYVSEKDLGPTPPNVYDLSLREEPFHGVRAVRLNPVGGGNMFGRDGMLAHSYMLGPNGQSNGCVSFNDYPTFLNAVLSGEVNRLVVVEHLAGAPGPKTAWGWIPRRSKPFSGGPEPCAAPHHFEMAHPYKPLKKSSSIARRADSRATQAACIMVAIVPWVLS